MEYSIIVFICLLVLIFINIYYTLEVRKHRKLMEQLVQDRLEANRLLNIQQRPGAYEGSNRRRNSHEKGRDGACALTPYAIDVYDGGDRSPAKHDSNNHPSSGDSAGSSSGGVD